MQNALPASPARDPIGALEQIAARDPGQRGIANLVQWGALAAAARALWGTRHAGIVSGFYLPIPKVGETDGPPGAKAIGRALEKLGASVVYVTDQWNAPLFVALGLDRVWVYRPGMLNELGVTHLVSLERPVSAADGRNYSM